MLEKYVMYFLAVEKLGAKPKSCKALQQSKAFGEINPSAHLLKSYPTYPNTHFSDAVSRGVLLR